MRQQPGPNHQAPPQSSSNSSNSNAKQQKGDYIDFEEIK